MKINDNMKGKKSMIVGVLIVVGAIIAAGIVLGLRIAVGESILIVDKEEAHFPVVSGFNLDRKEFEFPRDFEGEYNLVIVPFQQKQQLDVNTWIPAAQELERTIPGLVYYELPTIYKLPTLSRTFINEGMRAGIPDQTSRERTITLYLDKKMFKDALDIRTEEEISLFLVNRKGELLWRSEGTFSEEKAQDLITTLEKIME